MDRKGVGKAVRPAIGHLTATIPPPSTFRKRNPAAIALQQAAGNLLTQRKLVVINRPSEDGGRAGFGQTDCVCQPKPALNFNPQLKLSMNPKTPARFSIALESRARAAVAPQFSKAVYTRCAASQPGYYIIRLRLHTRSHFRPRLRFL